VPRPTANAGAVKHAMGSNEKSQPAAPRGNDLFDIGMVS
jgi:hypothetical protein